MANHMAEVAKMLGVEIGEAFTIIDLLGNKSSELYYFTDTDLMINGSSHCAESSILYNLIVGCYCIKRKSWKPKYNELFWVVHPDGDIVEYIWPNSVYSNSNYKLGNCYRTKEEAEANRDKWVAFYASDEVLEV